MIWVGTSGWQYRSWKGEFYPTGLPQRAWLDHYATRLPVVEVNNSFYRLPEETTFDRWREATPSGFVFVVKASRYITHIRRLRDAKDAVDLLWDRAGHLRAKLGPILFQLPPTLRADTGLLGDFLAILPTGMRAAFEFRHDSWQTKEIEGLLDRAGAAWVVPDRPGAREPRVVTGGWSYLRFHQGSESHPAYGRRKLRAWAEWIADSGPPDVYAFFNNDELAAAPADAVALMDLLEELGQGVARPARIALDPPKGES